ncbi:E3 ubiquitin-protein ligase MIB2 [Cottoperca gobio]|uniref:E3 ubiquitin-protein ligase MIB2 n=1 Tax=Cottoperca gobio TaxID=56716 RepID=A0A6J2Q012_COTGO|nr:E3 ubiquitin-protein ligase MIB2 [Cottoperca gobio]
MGKILCGNSQVTPDLFPETPLVPSLPAILSARASSVLQKPRRRSSSSGSVSAARPRPLRAAPRPGPCRGSMEVGMRVVRGLDWKWGNQDDSEGHIGTVVEIGRQGSTTTPDKTVVVQWDSGTRTNYRTGYQGSFDLLLYDNAQIGVRHSNIICDSCKKHGIMGMRWKCKVCFDYDLCTQCYMNNKHDLGHAFERYETAHSQPVCLAPRQNLPRIILKGIFQGVKVVRGPDWDWGNQDGGEGKVGKVVDIRGWDTESGRSVASVTWSNGTTNVYRMGHKGKVDLKYVSDGQGGFYYKDHLPRLGEHAELQRQESADGHSFQQGDKVKCLLEMEILRQMQEGHGGWNPKMAEYICRIGTVHRITDRGDVRVQYSNNIRWTFHPGALTKVNTFGVGELVKVLEDIESVKRLQAGHGEWTDSMAPVLGQAGKVLKVYADGDLRVAFGGQTWTFNPACLSAQTMEVDANLMTAENPNESGSTVISVLEKLLSQSTEQDNPSRLVIEAAHGSTNKVRELVQKYPDKHHVYPQLSASGLVGTTELSVGTALACFLAQEGADINYANHKGKSPLDLVADSTMMQLIKSFSEKHRLQRLQAITCGQSLSSASLRRVHTTPNTMTNLVLPTLPGPSECLICSELALLVLFCPCQHSVACEECAHRMKKCIKCQVTITKKIRQDQTEVDCSPGTENSEQHNLLEQLQSRYRQMEERITCPICIDNHIKLVFQCGHASCIDCSATLKTCPICRQTIRERIQLFV